MNVKKVLKLFSAIVIAVTLLFGVFLFVTKVILVEPEVPTFEFSGVVKADGKPLEGATVFCGGNETITNANGEYSFSNLTKVVKVYALKDGYCFPEKPVYVNCNKSNVDFSGFEFYEKTGVVLSNNIPIYNAKIIATSKAGVFSTTSDENGCFYFPKLAGETQLVATKDDLKFFISNISISDENVVISATTTLNGKVNADSEISNDDFVLYLNDEKIYVESDFTFSFNDVSSGSILKFSSEKFHALTSEIEIDVENAYVVFDVFKFFNVEVEVVSGNVSLENAVVKFDEFSFEADNFGKVQISNLFGEKTLSAFYEGFSFQDIAVSKEKTKIVFDGFFDLNVEINADISNDEILVLKLNDQICDAKIGEKITFKNAKLGQKFSVVDSAGFYVCENDFEISSTKSLKIKLEKLFDAVVKFESNGINLVGASAVFENFSGEIKSDENGIIELKNVHGILNFEVSLDGYLFDDKYSISFETREKTIFASKLFNLQGKVFSGNICIEGATITVENKTTFSNNQGIFEFENLFNNGNVLVSMDGYNSRQYSFSIENNILEIELDYDIEGVVECGDQYVSNVKVSIGDKSTFTCKNGLFSFKNLVGQNYVLFEKEFYSLSNEVVSKSEYLNVSTSYSVYGNASNSAGVVQNLKIILIDTNTHEKTITTTDLNGNFSFENLTKDYFLIYDTEKNIILKPYSYQISTGGIFNFLDSGYGFSGTIKNGNLPLEGVLVSIGETKTTTDSQGKYEFKLLTNPGVLVLFKEGFTFSENNIAISEEFDERNDVDFSSTYKIKGQIYCGNSVLENVEIFIGNKTQISDAYGNFEISGLSGQNSVVFKFGDFKFVENLIVTGYEKLEISATFEYYISLKTGDVEVNDAILVSNGEKINFKDGKYTISNAVIGQTFTFEKKNYNFEEITIESQSSEIQEVSCSYNLVGYVYSCSSPLSEVDVLLNGKTTKTNLDGKFVFDNLFGNNTISFSKTGFEFDNVDFSNSDEILVNAKYSISGYVKVGNMPLENVKVFAGEYETITNRLGHFEFKNLSKEEKLLFVKEGFEFSGDFIVNSPTQLSVMATFEVSGTVYSGNISNTFSGVLVTASNGYYTTTDTNGKYTLKGFSEEVSLTFEKEGYEKFLISGIKTCSFSSDANMTYSISILFSGIESYENITITTNGVKKEYSSNKVVLMGLSGENRIVFFKTNYLFSPSEIAVVSHQVISVSINKVFSVTGFAKTESGTAIAGAIVSAGGIETKTDTSGKYSISGLTNTTQLKIKLETYENTYEKIYGQISSTSVCDFIISDYQFATFLFYQGYENLDKAKSYQIYCRGEVQPEKYSGPQNFLSVFKKDTNNIKLYQDLNYGEPINIITITVDPRVGFLAYVDQNTKQVKYQRVQGDIVKKDLTTTYSTSWTESSYDHMISEFGINPEGYYPYIINKNTIANISSVSLEDGVYKFVMNLKTIKETYSNYAKKMKLMVSQQSVESFSKIQLTYQISTSGFIKQMEIDEHYTVKSMGVSVGTSAKIKYEFLTNSLNESIPPIDVSSSSAISSSLERSPITENTFSKELDLMFIKRKKGLLLI